MNKICTSFEQSKKLLELGLSPESADMSYEYMDECDGNFPYYSIPVCYPPENNKDIPCWSLMALNNIIKDNCERCEIHLRNDKKYNIFVTSGTFIYRSFDTYPNGFDDLFDACYEVVYWLKKKMKKYE